MKKKKVKNLVETANKADSDLIDVIDRKELEKAFDLFPEIIKQKKIQARYKKRILKKFEAFSRDLARRLPDPE